MCECVCVSVCVSVCLCGSSRFFRVQHHAPPAQAAPAPAAAPPSLEPTASLGLTRYTTQEADAAVARGEAFATGGTGDVFRVFLRGRAVAIKRVA